MANGYTQFLKRTLKMSLDLMKRRVLKAYRKVELQIYVFLTSTPGVCLMDFTRLWFYVTGKNPSLSVG